MRHALNQPDVLDSATLKKLADAISSLFPRTDALKEDSTRDFWRPIVFGALKSVYKPNENREIARYTLKYFVLTSTKEKGGIE